MEKNINRLAVAYPSGNTTAVVFDNPGTHDRKQLNMAILSAWKAAFPNHPEIEQCCFIQNPNNPLNFTRMEMLGGEFCGNATRSVVWLATGGNDCKGFVEASGVAYPLAFEVADGEVEVQMPLPTNGQLVTKIKEGFLVQLDGIAHVVVTSSSRRTAQSPRELLTSLLQTNAYKLTDQPCVGVTYYDQKTNQAEFCVWIKTVDTIFDETACGSGTSAIGIVAATKQHSSITVPVIQPSGESIVTRAVFRDNHVVTSLIKGTVTVLYDGELELS